MKTYFKYLWANPWKLVLMIVLIAFTQVFGWFVTAGDLDIEEHYMAWVRIGLGLLVTVIFVAVILQPYFEWRDGKDRK